MGRQVPPVTSLALDLTRLALALCVAFCHWTQGYFQEGWPDLTPLAIAAVGGFFVLSGYTIRLLTPEAESFSGRSFFVERLSRLWSVALPALLLTIVLDSVSRTVGHDYYQKYWGVFSTHSWFRIAVNVGFVSQCWGWDIKPFSNSPFWSLSYEAGFYVLYGVFRALRGARRLGALLAVALVLGPNVLLMSGVWLSGVLLYDWSERRSPWAWPLAIRVAVAGATGAALAWFAFGPGPRWARELTRGIAGFFTKAQSVLGESALVRIEQRRIEGYLLYGALAFWLLLFACLPVCRALNSRVTLPPRVRSWGRAAGNCTFPLYLLHFPCFVLLGALGIYDRHSTLQKLLWFAVLSLAIVLTTPYLDRFKRVLRRQLQSLLDRFEKRDIGPKSGPPRPRAEAPFGASSRFETRSLVLGALALLLGLSICMLGIVRSDGGGLDFPVLYEMGKGVASGTDVYSAYDTAYYRAQYNSTQYGMFYPPTTGIALLPLALLPYAPAKWSFTLLTILAVVFGVRSLFRLRPESPRWTWYVAAAVVLASSAMRWGGMLLQLAPLVFGLLCWFVSALHRGRSKLAIAIALLVLCLKVTLAAPFLGLLLVYRRFGAALGIGASWLLLTGVGFWRLGPQSVAGYLRNVAGLEDLTQISSPDPFRPIALPRLDWVSLGYGFTGSLTRARLLSVTLAAFFSLWLLREWWRSSKALSLENTALFLPALVCLNSCALYHHQYDAILFFAPLFLAWICLERRFTPAVVLCAPLVLLIVLVPIGKVQALLLHSFGLFGVGLLKLSFPIVFTLAMIGSLLNLSRQRLNKSGVPRPLGPVRAHNPSPGVPARAR